MATPIKDSDPPCASEADVKPNFLKVLDLSQESFDGPATQVADGIWTVSEKHFPGYSSELGLVMNNKCFVFKIKDENNQPGLMVYGVNSPASLKKVMDLEKSTGIQIKIVLSSGDAHHMSLKAWIEELNENVRFYMSGVKFPKTRNGKDILETFPKRVELFDDTKIEKLEFLKKQGFEFICFNQTMTYPDESSQPSNTTDVKAKKKEGFWKTMARVGGRKFTERALYISLYLSEYKTLIADHHLATPFTKEQIAKAAFVLRMKMQPDKMLSGLAMQYAKPENLEIHIATYKHLFSLPILRVTDLHSWPTYWWRQYEKNGDFEKEISKSLNSFGELDTSGAKFNRSMCIIS